MYKIPVFGVTGAVAVILQQEFAYMCCILIDSGNQSLS